MSAIETAYLTPAAHRCQPSDVLDYYSDAGPDYAAWSPQFNMHFGLIERPVDLFHRERMLDAMNGAVIRRLDLGDAPTMVVDLGCGMGATMRWAASHYPRAWFVGVTIVDWQVAGARESNVAHAAADRLEVHPVDYTATGLPGRSADGVYALESACHGAGQAKAAVIREAARLLRPGGTFVVADGFRTDRSEPLRGLRGTAYRALCRHWAIEELANLDAFVTELDTAGFEQIEVEDVSWRVAPSVAHVPWVTLQFLWGAFLDGDRVDGWRRSNVIACLLTLLLGLCRWNFSYCIITARSPLTGQSLSSENGSANTTSSTRSTVPARSSNAIHAEPADEYSDRTLAPASASKPKRP